MAVPVAGMDAGWLGPLIGIGEPWAGMKFPRGVGHHHEAGVYHGRRQSDSLFPRPVDGFWRDSYLDGSGFGRILFQGEVRHGSPEAWARAEESVPVLHGGRLSPAGVC